MTLNTVNQQAVSRAAVRLYGTDEAGKREAAAYIQGREDAIAALTHQTTEPTGSDVSAKRAREEYAALKGGDDCDVDGFEAAFAATEQVSDDAVGSYREQAAEMLRNEREAYRAKLVIPGIADSPQLSPNDHWAIAIRTVAAALASNNAGVIGELRAAIEAERRKWFCSGPDCEPFDHGRDEGFEFALKSFDEALSK